MPSSGKIENLYFQIEANQIADRIFGLLEAKSDWNIDRCRIVGGFGKGTSTSIKVVRASYLPFLFFRIFFKSLILCQVNSRYR